MAVDRDIGGENRLAYPSGHASRFFYQERMWGRQDALLI